MSSTTNSCALEVGHLDAEQFTGLLQSLTSQLPVTLQYDTDVGPLKIYHAKPIHVCDLNDCLSEVTVNGEPHQRDRLLENVSAFSALDHKSKAWSRYVILHHDDESMSVIPKAKLKKASGLIFIEQDRPEGIAEASVSPGTITETVGTGWSHTAIKTIQQGDPAHTRLTISMAGSHQTEDVQSLE